MENFSVCFFSEEASPVTVDLKVSEGLSVARAIEVASQAYTTNCVLREPLSKKELKDFLQKFSYSIIDEENPAKTKTIYPFSEDSLMKTSEVFEKVVYLDRIAGF